MEEKIKKLLKNFVRLFQLIEDDGERSDEDDLIELTCFAIIGIVASEKGEEAVLPCQVHITVNPKTSPETTTDESWKPGVYHTTCE